MKFHVIPDAVAAVYDTAHGSTVVLRSGTQITLAGVSADEVWETVFPPSGGVEEDDSDGTVHTALAQHAHPAIQTALKALRNPDGKVAWRKVVVGLLRFVVDVAL